MNAAAHPGHSGHADQSRLQPERGQKGAATVEFALVVIIFFTLLVGIAEIGRLLFTLNAASEATRLGARLASVCDKNDPAIKARMHQILGNMRDEQFDIEYLPAACDASTCKSVTVALATTEANGLKARFSFFIPFYSAAIDLPSFATTVPREHMNSSDAKGGINTLCTAP